MERNKNFLAITFIFTFFYFFQAIGDNIINSSSVNKSAGFTPIRFTFIAGCGSWPNNVNIYGLNLGLVNDNDERYSDYEYKVCGLDFAWFISLSDNVYGLQLAGYNETKYSAGLQMAFGNYVQETYGMQLGFINIAEESSSFQLGLYNQADKDSRVFQLGLLCFLENGFLPFFPIFNFTINNTYEH